MVPELILLTTLAKLSWAVLPNNYRDLSAVEKQSLQWEQILDSRYTFDNMPTEFPRPDINGTVLTSAEYLKTTFVNYNDEQPGQRFRETVGTYGIVAKVTFRTFKTSTVLYTGVFHSGGIGLIRLSLDGESGSLEPYVPLMAVKIYLDGDWSLNYLQVNSLLGQTPNHNYFRDNMSNIIDTSFFPPDNLQAKAFTDVISLLPGDALARPENNGNLGQYDTSTKYANGTEECRPVAPYETIFVPNPKLAIAANSTRDFRIDIAEIVKVGDVIYTVFARHTPDTPVTELIGEVVCDSEMVISFYGDVTLFFRHPSERWRL